MCKDCFFTYYLEKPKTSPGTTPAQSTSSSSKASHMSLVQENESRIQIFRQMELAFYYKIIYSLKKILWSLHK